MLSSIRTLRISLLRLSPSRYYHIEVPQPPLTARNYDERLARNSQQAYMQLQNVMKSSRVAANITRHRYYEKPNVRKVRLSELKVRKRSFEKIQKLTEWVEWRRGDGPGLRVRQTRRPQANLTKSDDDV